MNCKTVLIGSNGTGKSSLLGGMLDSLLTEMSNKKKSIIKNSDYDYELTAKGKELYKITNDSNHNLDELGAILAITNTYTDKFYFPTKNGLKSHEKYIYCGLKTASNNIFFSNSKIDMFEMLLKIMKSHKRVLTTVNLLDYLGFGNEFTFSLKSGRNTKIVLKEQDINKVDFSSLGLNRFLNSEEYLANRNDILNTVANVYDEGCVNVEVDLSEDNSVHEEYLHVLLSLLKAKILSLDKMTLFSSTGYDMHESSSGEFNIVRTFLSIISNIKDNSIVFIDEPEISLHPNWQIEFINLLDMSLSEFKNCHTIIATHSNFILSNLNPDNSAVLNLTSSGTSRKVYIQDKIENSPFAQSPENILYSFFGVTGYQNKFFEKDLRILVDYLSNPIELNSSVETAFNRVNKFKFDEESPIRHILLQVSDLIEAQYAK